MIIVYTVNARRELLCWRVTLFCSSEVGRKAPRVTFGLFLYLLLWILDELILSVSGWELMSVFFWI